MKIIITGATGFVGKNLGKYLSEKGNTVYDLSLRNNKWNLNSDTDALIHLAGKAHDTKNISSESAYFEINTNLTQRVFDRFLESEIRDFIYFSSVKATADSVEGILCEEHISAPQTPYGKSKLAAEEYLLSKILPEGKRLFIIRPCMIHGPGNKGNLNLLYKMVEKGIPWPLAGFDNRRSFLSISNLNFLIEKILSEKAVPSGIYNFADDETLSTNQLVNIIAGTLHNRAWLVNVSPRLIIFFAKIGDYIKAPLNSERLRKLTESYEVSNAKIKSALGIEHLPLSAEEGLKKTIQIFSKKL